MSNSIGIRGSLVVGTLAVLGLGMVPASASAITINRAGATNATINITAAPGETNNITVTRTAPGDFGVYTFTETGATAYSLTGSAGCTGTDTGIPSITVTCNDLSGADIDFIVANLNGANDTFTAGAVTGMDDAVTVNGGDGDDVLTGANSAGVLEGQPTDTFNGGAGTDRMTGLDGIDIYNGDAGIDRAIMDTTPNSGATVTIDGTANDNDGDNVADDNVGLTTESITGTSMVDVLTGNCTAANTFTGLAGSDTLQDPNGCTTTEFFGGGAGNDVFNGRQGVDTVTYTANTAAQPINVALDVAPGSPNDGLGGFDFVSFDIETIYGTPGNDTINGSAAPAGVTLWGRLGNDTIVGSNFNDVIRGEAGNDALNCAGGGNDMYVLDPADVPPATNCETPIGG